MFLDASVIVAIVAREDDAVALEARLDRATNVWVSPMVVYEACLGLARIGRVSSRDAHRIVVGLLERVSAENMPITAACGEKAIAAFERYGKGRHPAGLNMGDCFAYACAQELGVPLLFKGDDFSKTDIEAA